MRLTHLSLHDYRNYAQLELPLPAGPVLFVGENAQGKTNLLEAVYLLATTRSLRAAADSELLRRETRADPLAAARVVGRTAGARGATAVEVAVARREGSAGADADRHTLKRLRVNGAARRATDVIGVVLAVFFTSLDIDLITGPPAGRRRYLDITLSLLDHAYVRALQRYNRVVQQRNSLLRQIGEGHAGPDQLLTWDEELVGQGAQIISRRAEAVRRLDEHAAGAQARLSDGRERLAIAYVPQVCEHAGEAFDLADLDALRNQYRLALGRRRRKEIAAGISLVGPHRDDLRFTLDGEPVATFGSRAQQRTTALALRLAEAAYLQAQGGDAPILLLDDILSELDERRRAAVLAMIADAEQALITTADLDRFGGDFLRRASVYAVREGTVELLTAPADAE